MDLDRLRYGLLRIWTKSSRRASGGGGERMRRYP